MIMSMTTLRTKTDLKSTHCAHCLAHASYSTATQTDGQNAPTRRSRLQPDGMSEDETSDDEPPRKRAMISPNKTVRQLQQPPKLSLPPRYPRKSRKIKARANHFSDEGGRWMYRMYRCLLQYTYPIEN